MCESFHAEWDITNHKGAQFATAKPSASVCFVPRFTDSDSGVG